MLVDIHTGAPRNYPVVGQILVFGGLLGLIRAAEALHMHAAKWD